MPYNYIKQKEIEEDEEDNNRDPYEISIKKTNKQGLEQPKGSEDDILPTMPCGILIIGRSGSGKTQCAVNLLTNPNLLGNYFDKIIMLTGTNPDKELIADLKLKKKDIILKPG